jgi:hypothetical protein
MRVDEFAAHGAKQRMACGIVPVDRSVERHADITLPDRDESEAIGNGHDRSEPRRRARRDVCLGGEVGVLAQQHHVGGVENVWKRCTLQLDAVSTKRLAFGPGDEVAARVRRTWRVDDAENRQAVVDQSDGDRGASQRMDEGPRAVVRVDVPTWRTGFPLRGARLFADVAVVRERGDEAIADDSLDLFVDVGVVCALVSNSLATVELFADGLAGSEGCFGCDVELCGEAPE